MYEGYEASKDKGKPGVAGKKEKLDFYLFICLHTSIPSANN